jgi:predicted nucleic acid-binding protein
MMTMADRTFADTNIVLRLLNSALPEYTAVEQLVRQVRTSNSELWISRQVIREYLVQVTRPGFLAVPLSVEQVETHVKTLRSLFQVADETNAVTDKLIELLKEFPSGGKQIHDANIVATMLVYNIDSLLTLNVEDMKRFATKVKVISPISGA